MFSQARGSRWSASRAFFVEGSMSHAVRRRQTSLLHAELAGNKPPARSVEGA